MQYENPSLQKRLYRSIREKMIAGVCGGVAEYLNVDPTIVRLVWVVLTLVGGSGILIYFIAWFIIPKNPEHIVGQFGQQVYTTPPPGSAEGFDPQAQPAGGSQMPPQAAPVFESSKKGYIFGIIIICIGGLVLMKNLFGFMVWSFSHALRLTFFSLILIGAGILLMIRRK